MSDANPYTTPQAELSVEDGRPLASRSARMTGAGIDGAIGFVIAIALYSITGFWDRILTGQLSFVELLELTVLGLVSFFVIHGYPLAYRGQTLGKMAARTQIVDVATDELVSLPRLILRRYVPIAALTMIPGIGSLLATINILFIFRRDRRCVHDHLAATKVVEYRKP